MTTRLPLSDYDFEFPEELIASRPAEPRDSARLLVARKSGGAVEHRVFSDLPDLLMSGDCLVINRTKVLACRLMGRKATGGKTEILLVKELEPGLWSALGSGLKRGGALEFPKNLTAVVEGLNEDGEYLVRFSRLDMTSYCEECGLPPLPPYIARRRDPLPDDRNRYQTVFAADAGSIAAPTAGLHFTPALIERLRERGVAIAEITLHVGRGTFRPIVGEDAASHRMLPEWFRVDEKAAAAITQAKRAGHRIVSVGTTSTRTLETLAARQEGFGPGEGWSSLYIAPGHQFMVPDALITNFHLPKSTPLLLACAFLGRDPLLAAYREAISRRYRLYSFGDAMLIV